MTNEILKWVLPQGLERGWGNQQETSALVTVRVLVWFLRHTLAAQLWQKANRAPGGWKDKNAYMTMHTRVITKRVVQLGQVPPKNTMGSSKQQRGGDRDDQRGGDLSSVWVLPRPRAHPPT